jgi:RND superfamily putative drug exporter
MYAVANIGSVFVNTSSFSLPSSDTSVIAQSKLSQEFPNASEPSSSSIVLLVGNNITGSAGKNATLAVTQAILNDPKIKYLGTVQSLYTAYAEELDVQATVGLGVLGYALSSMPTLPTAFNETAQLVWSPAAVYSTTWAEIAGSLPAGTNSSQANWPAYVETNSYLNSSPVEQQILAAFYNGISAASPGFNQTVTSACLQARNVTPCAETSMRTTFPTLVPTLFPNASNQTLPLLVVRDVGISNMTSWNALQTVGAILLGEEAGLPPRFMLIVWQTFPQGTASPSSVMAWSVGATDRLPLNRFPLPVSPALMSAFVSKGGAATMVIVAFTKPDNYTEGGKTPVFQDIDEIGRDTSTVIHSSATFDGLSYYQTGNGPVDETISNYTNSILGLLLTITIVLLAVAIIIYFRAPAPALVTFAGVGISVVVTLASLYVVSTYVTAIMTVLESILLIFLMAIVTDYSIFMMARYREELVEGSSPGEAIVASVRWAGQSIVTSGLTVCASGVAMSLSGLSILRMFGIALSIAVAVSIIMALTVIPAILTLVGPRVFWPYTGKRFARQAEKRREGVRSGRTYLSRAGATVTRRPGLVILLILLISAPVVVVALSVPVSYDTTNLGLPSSNPTQQGLTVLEQRFGPSVFAPSWVLVTFSGPLFLNSSVNLQELENVASLTQLINSTSGVSGVGSLVGSGGAPVSDWLNLSKLPPGPRALLLIDEKTYVGIDGRTVEFQVSTNANGYSAAGGEVFGTIHGELVSFQSTHPEVDAVYFGGAAQVTRDAQALTNSLMEWMLIGVAVGIFVVLFLILGTAIVPALALGAIGLSIIWAWVAIYFVVDLVKGIPLLFFIPLVLIVLTLGLGMDYNALVLTRVKEERLRGASSSEAIQRAVTHVGGVVTAAAVILGGPFIVLGVLSSVGIIAAIGLGIGIATLLQSFVAQTYLIPAILAIGKDKIWWGIGTKAPQTESAHVGGPANAANPEAGELRP